MGTKNYRVLITGGTGVVGKYVANALHKQGYTVRIFARDLQKHAWVKKLWLEYASGDISDPAAVSAAMEGVTHVVHIVAWSVCGPAACRIC